jgi:hypothetical protein
MSGYPSMPEVRQVITDTLAGEGRDPTEFNVAGIARDAFHRGPGHGYRAREADVWAQAVARHRINVPDPVEIDLVVTVQLRPTPEVVARLGQIARELDEGNGLFDLPDAVYTLPSCLAAICNLADDGLSSLFQDPIIGPFLGGYSAEPKDNA